MSKMKVALEQDLEQEHRANERSRECVCLVIA